VVILYTANMGIKFKSNEDFFKNWNPIMAYVLGFLFADGNIENSPYMRGKYIKAINTDKKIIEKIKKYLDSEHKIQSIKDVNSKIKTKYILRIGSHKMYNSLENIGMTPNKSLTMKFPNIPKNLQRYFILGYFDGDGCVYIDNYKKTKGRRLLIAFTSGSKFFLESLSNILNEKLSLKQNKVYNSHRSYQLRYSTHDSVKIFKLLYKKQTNDLYLKRKFDIFKKFFNLRPLWVDPEVLSVLKS